MRGNYLLPETVRPYAKRPRFSKELIVSKQKQVRWSARLDRFLYPVLGPAQLGNGKPERVLFTAPRCPMCGELMSEHRIVRSLNQTTSTRIYCPNPNADNSNSLEKKEQTND